MQETKNIKFVAWLMLNDVHPDKVEKISRGKAKYVYDMTDAVWALQKRDFSRSDFIKYGQCIDATVDLAY